MEGLPGDIIMDILAWLPEVKSTARARCVCKSWNSLICEYYLLWKSLPPAMAGIILEDLRKSDTMFFKTRDPTRYNLALEIVGYSDGLVLCDNFMGTAHPAVCNLVAGRWKNLSVPDCYGDVDLIGIGFDSRLSRHYRVLGNYTENSTDKFIMFRSETNSWVDCVGNYELFDDLDADDVTVAAVYLNGIFIVRHAMYEVDEGYDYETFELFAVDIEEKNCREIELPSNVPEAWSRSRLEVSDSRLHLEIPSDDTMLVWTLEDYDNNQWVMKNVRRHSNKSMFSLGVVILSGIFILILVLLATLSWIILM